MAIPLHFRCKVLFAKFDLPMPVILLVGPAARFISQIVSYFEDKYSCCILQDPFHIIRSLLSDQEEQKLYLVPHLSKPERYEIFCLARKNSQLFLSIIDGQSNEGASSDKNQLLLDSFDGHAIESQLLGSRVSPSAANRRSKGNPRSLRDLKAMIQRVNREYGLESLGIISKECEDRLTKAWSLGVGMSIGDAEECYKRLMDEQLRSKGILKHQT